MKLSRCFRAILFLISVIPITLTMGCQTNSLNELAQSLNDIEASRVEARRLNADAISLDDPQQQKEMLEAAVRLDDMFGEAHNNLGVVYFQLNHPYLSALELQRAADLMPATVMPYANLAVLHASLGQWDRALDYAKQAYERDPHDIMALRVLGKSLHAMRAEPGEIEPVLERLALRDPSATWRQWATKQSLQRIDQNHAVN